MEFFERITNFAKNVSERISLNPTESLLSPTAEVVATRVADTGRHEIHVVSPDFVHEVTLDSVVSTDGYDPLTDNVPQDVAPQKILAAISRVTSRATEIWIPMMQIGLVRGVRTTMYAFADGVFAMMPFSDGDRFVSVEPTFLRRTATGWIPVNP